jgi:hypothetical protein
MKRGKRSLVLAPVIPDFFASHFFASMSLGNEARGGGKKMWGKKMEKRETQLGFGAGQSPIFLPAIFCLEGFG